MKRIKFITCIYNNLYGTIYGGRPNRELHYKWSLLSILKISDADFVCYTSKDEYQELYNFFHIENGIDENKLEIRVFNLSDTPHSDILQKYKDVEKIKKGDRCLEIQYMKLNWFNFEDGSYDYYYWIDSGLSHCGLIPKKYLSQEGPNNRGYYESSLFSNKWVNNLVNSSNDKFLLIGKENKRNFWSQTVNQKHFKVYDNSIHVIGGLFGGKKELWSEIIDLFNVNLNVVSNFDKRLYHEEDILTLMYRNNSELFESLYFETWWHEDERINGIDDMVDFTKKNKSFYRVLEELNNG